MVLRHIEDFENAKDDASALRAARRLVDALKQSPLSIHFVPIHQGGRPHLTNAVVHAMCLGQMIQPVKRLRVSLWEDNSEVAMLIPDVTDPKDSEEERIVKEVMEADSFLARRTDRMAALLEGVGVKVDRDRFSAMASE